MTGTSCRELVYIECPECGGSVPEPFTPGSLENGFHKERGDKSPCRFVVSVDPSGGNDHRFEVVRQRGASYEDAKKRLFPEHKRRLKRHLGLLIAQENAG